MLSFRAGVDSSEKFMQINIWEVCSQSPMTCAVGQHGLHICVCLHQYVLCRCVCKCTYLAGPDAAHWPIWTPTQPQFLIDGEETVRLQKDTQTYSHKHINTLSVSTTFTLHMISLLARLFPEKTPISIVISTFPCVVINIALGLKISYLI